MKIPFIDPERAREALDEVGYAASTTAALLA